ncbi:MAG: HD domain-containing protein [Oscillospiraceae bacterium]|jgi:3'-5' exoribonuclease|nr:HD domain-containing protein [Oscillospiraceae bacterium]
MNFSVINKTTGLVEGYALVKRNDKRINSKGSLYLDMLLCDAGDEISAKLWDYNEESFGEFTVNSIVKVRGTISVFNGSDQLRIERIRNITQDDNIKIEDFVQTAKYDGESMFFELVNIADGFEDMDLKNLVKSILTKYKESLLYYPAAYRLHHAIRGGLLFHTLSIVRLAQGICSVYPFVDRDLLFTGAVLHDIGKTLEYEVSDTGIVQKYTVDGTLIGHIIRGAMEVRKTGEELGLPEEKIMLVEHMLISHHGDPEFGAAKRPMFLEAELLSQLDLMDARVDEISKSVESIDYGDFSARQWALENRQFYNHGRKEMSGADLNIG